MWASVEGASLGLTRPLLPRLPQMGSCSFTLYLPLVRGQRPPKASFCICGASTLQSEVIVTALRIPLHTCFDKTSWLVHIDTVFLEGN